ncbi:MAG: DNA-binding response regulator [Chloroflexi bacterium]|nr:MAG: response regulator transcription factor [Anaerolineae bacterium]MBZ0320632.1 response regulator transcription factor [Anaerolineae bacterium]MCQ3929041.1 DNA-binding response regulator [Chloroflexota bacterium]
MGAKTTILVIDDDEIIQKLITTNCEREGYHVVVASNGRDGLRMLYQNKIHLVVLDLGLPDMDGYMVCQRIREVSKVPVVMLTAFNEPEYIVRGFDVGADDYIEKPFNKEVLMARIRANLRRASTPYTPTRSGIQYNDRYLSINLDERRVTVDGAPAKLTPIEFKLLEMLVRFAPRVVDYRALLENVWGFEYINDIDYLRVYIWHLRKKIEVDPQQPIYILNEMGVGYRFEHQH